MYVESAESAVLSRKIRETAKTVTYEATGHCVAYYSIQQRIHNVSWVTHIPNGYILQYKNLLAADSRHFAFDRQSGMCSGIIYPYNGTGVYLYVYA